MFLPLEQAPPYSIVELEDGRRGAKWPHTSKKCAVSFNGLTVQFFNRYEPAKVVMPPQRVTYHVLTNWKTLTGGNDNG